MFIAFPGCYISQTSLENTMGLGCPWEVNEGDICPWEGTGDSCPMKEDRTKRENRRDQRNER